MLFLITGLLLMGDVITSNAQQGNWSGQERIPDYYNFTEEPPYLIADQNHTIHAFNSQPLDLAKNDSPKAIYYRQWTLENGWTNPNDILYDDNGKDINLLGAVSDEFGIVHLIFQGSNQYLYYTYAYLAQAGFPASWATPQLIAAQPATAGPGFENVGTIAVDGSSDKLLVIFSGWEYGNGLYYVFSTDRGNTWSSPYPVYLAGDVDLLVTDPELFLSESGSFYAVWGTFKKDGFGGPGYYAAWDSEKQSWSNSMDLDTPGIRTPSVVEFNGDVFVSYHLSSSNGNWWRRSIDGGQTWTYPDQVSALHVGTNGGLSFVVDSNGTLHAFFGARIDDNNHGMWHVVWLGSSWSNAEAVVKGRQIKDDIGGEGFDPRSARAVVSNGNVILVTWGTDGAAGMNGAWYSYKVLDTPELHSQPLYIPTALPDRTGWSETPISTGEIILNTPVLADDLKNESPNLVRNRQFSILIGVFPAVLLVIGIIILRILQHNQNP